MKHRHGEEALLLVALMAFSACADPANRIAGLKTSTADVQTGTAQPQSEERAALTKIARLVAVALDNEPARQRVKRDMRAAPFREHKLALGPYLRSKEGSALLAAMATANGTSDGDVLATLNAIRPLEFYMPVPRHRETWTGTASVLVVSQLDESEPIVSFDSRGRSVPLDKKAAPEQPTLSIVPVETAFNRPMNSATSRNVRDADGAAIGTLEPFSIKGSKMVVCDAACDGSGDTSGGGTGAGGTTTSTLDPGLYLDFSRILDMKEPWFRGDPEIEVHIQGPKSTAAATVAEDLSCSGEHALDSRKVFNQDTGFWEGHVMLFTQTETVNFVNTFKDGFHILFWEDDNDPCVLKLDSEPLMSLLKSTADAVSTVALKVVFPGASPILVGVIFTATLFKSPGDWLQTNDDFLGVATSLVGSPYSYPDNTHVIMDGTTLNGRATIVYRQ